MVSLRRSLLALSLIGAGFGAACGDGDDPITPAPLAAPVDVTVTATAPNAVVVTWSAVAGASSYEIERAQGATSTSYTAMGTTGETTYTDRAVTAQGQYRYRVTAVAGTRRSGASNPSAVVTTPAEGPRVAVITSDITSNRTFFRDTTYVLSGFIKVGNGATLTVQDGTTVQGDFDIPGSSLFVLRGARIVANGTRERPIVFTSERPAGQRQAGDWGGIIIIGNGIVNRTGPTQIEGTGTPQNINPPQFYQGGTDNNDNSGTLRFVRIEFAGFPTAPNQELNSLTMAAVGAGTTIEYVQVLLGLDDSFEWFGGAVNGKYLVSYEAGDDHFDASEGYVGRNQFMIAFQSHRPIERPGLAGGVASDPQLVENDGCWADNCIGGNNNTNAQPFTVPVFANFTFVGAPNGAWDTPSGNYGMMLRRGTGGLYVNGVITRLQKNAISLRGQNTMARATEGNLGIRNVFVSQTAGVFQPVDTTASNIENRQYALDLAANGIVADTVSSQNLFTAFPTNTIGANASAFDWTPRAGSPIATGGLNDFASLPAQLRAATTGTGQPNSTITPTTYRGAAAPGGEKWWQGWTNYARN